MARKVITEKDKKNKKKKIIIISLIVVALVAVGAFCLWKFVINKPTSKPTTITVLDNYEEYGYSLNDKDSKYFKSEYEKLKDILGKDTVDEKEYATQVARLFVIDFYTLNTKMNKYDIGGNEYFYTDKKAMFEQKAMDTMYSSLADNTYGDRKQELPEIKNVETVSTEKTTYTLNEKEVDAYQVKLKMEYVKAMGYDDEASVVICKEDGVRWSVVDFQPTLKPKYS